MADNPLEEPDEDVTIEVLPHTTDVIKEYCTDQTLDTDVDLDVLPASMDGVATTLTRKGWFDIGTTLLNADDESLRADHYGRRVMRNVHTEINT
jgi:hypothetical protein